MEMYQKDELNSKVRNTARMCIEDFLIKALEDDLDLYINGTCTQILKKIDRRIFESVSRYFLGNMIWRILEREYERRPLEIQRQIMKASQELADKIIADYEQRFGTDHRKLFRFIQGDLEWLKRELRK